MIKLPEGERIFRQKPREAVWYKRNRTCSIAACKVRNRMHRKEEAVRNRVNRVRLKNEILSFYGPNGKLGCCWEGCDVIDEDMLTLDHVNNDGSKHRKAVGNSSKAVYLWVKKNNFPIGFQTLCRNHQWKKEMLRRREAKP